MYFATKVRQLLQLGMYRLSQFVIFMLNTAFLPWLQSFASFSKITSQQRIICLMPIISVDQTEGLLSQNLQGLPILIVEATG